MPKMPIFKNNQHKRSKVRIKSQVSLFVILGLILLMFVIAGISYYNYAKKAKIEEEAKKLASIGLQAEEFRQFADDCIRKESFDGLKRIAQTGGYIDVPRLIDFKGTSFWHLDQVNIQPFLNQTQERLIDYINSNVPKCLENGNLTKYGFSVAKDKPSTFIEFGSSDITIKVVYKIKLSQTGFSKEYSGFFNTFSIRYRQIFEAASEINEKLYDPDFDDKDPFKKLGYLRSLDFDLSYSTPETDVMVFTVTDKKSITPENMPYSFDFAAKFGKSDLKRITDLQNNSATNPAFLPFVIYSPDKKAQLEISKDTTISLNGQSVKGISTEQTYPKEAVTKDVPVYKKNNQVLQKQNIKYNLDNPVYTFEPSGLLFNKFEKLTIYYDKKTDDSKGVGILMGKNGFWVPIISKHEPEQKRVFSNILGFTQFTAVNCASQQVKRTIAEHFFKPNAGCFVGLAFTILSFIAFFTIILSGIAVISGSALGFTFNSAWQIGINAVAGALGTTAVSVGIAYTAISVASIATTIAGGLGAFYDKSPDNCIAFYPICDQNIMIQKEEKDGTGRCIPDNNARVAAGQPISVCAQIKKCNMLKKFLCMPCSVKCTAQFY